MENESNEEMDNIMKIIKSYEESGLLIKSISNAIQTEAKEQKSGFISMLLGTLGPGLLGNPLTGKGVKWSNIPGRGIMRAKEGTIRAGKGTIRAGQNFNCHFIL